MPADEGLERILQLAKAARDAEASALWKTDLEAAFEAHGEAVESLWAELHRHLDARIDIGDPVHRPKLPPDPRKELKKQIVAALKEELPGMVASVIDQF